MAGGFKLRTLLTRLALEKTDSQVHTRRTQQIHQIAMKFHELQAQRALLSQKVKEQEKVLQTEWQATLGSNNPLLMGLNLLSSTFSKARFNPYVSLLQAAVFVFQDFKEQKLPNKDNFLEYFVSIADRITGKQQGNEA